MKKLAIILFVLLATGSTMGQLADQASVDNINRTSSLGLNPAASAFSLIDLSRVKWSNSYSVNFFSGGNYSGSVGVFNSSMFYEFSKKLSLTLNVGVAHNASAMWQDTDHNARILPGFILDYHPSDKFQLSIGFQSYAGYMSPYNYYNSFSNDRFR